ncbi:MAG TPA: glycoside hydrolase family 28 protein [Candidatus Acidoferrales bacterium]|nr:glycoside hydrolase family 28 protein [Candidatus Acidoferrales bacterium]
MTLRRTFLKSAGLGLAAASLAFRRVATAGPLGSFDVKAFGATGDGKSLDTLAVNKAIEAAVLAGGGTVAFPAGNYLCFSVRLRSNVALYLDEGATIIAADTPEGGASGYDPAEPNQWDRYQDFGHSHFHNSLIWGDGIGNAGITGPGHIWGKGLSRGQGAMNPGVGNKSIALRNCHNILLRDFSILHGGHFGILASGVDNLTIDNLMIDTNRDGMDIDSCRNVRVSNCYVNSPWDDGICLKADYALGSARQTEFVTITNCYVSGCWQEGTMLDGTYRKFGPDQRVPHTGRIKFGTESSGGFRNVTISNCVFEGCQGLALESVDGALLEDVTVTNISMRDIMSAPIFVRLGRRLRGPDGTQVGTLKRVIISNLVCSNSVAALGSVISGIPGHYIEDVKISNVQILHQGGGTREDAAYQPPEYEDIYPEPDMFTAPPRPGRNGRGPDGQFVAEGQGRGAGRGPAAPVERHKMPSQGFYVRHVRSIQFENVLIQAAQEDHRPAFVLDDVQDADFFQVKTPHAADTPVFALHDVSGLNVHMCYGVKDTQLQKVDQKTL